MLSDYSLLSKSSRAHRSKQVGLLPQTGRLKSDAHQYHSLCPASGVLAPANGRNGSAGDGCPAWSSLGVSSPIFFEILDANSFFLAAIKSTTAKVKIPHISILGCITCTQHRVTLETGQAASRPGLRQNTGHRGQKTGLPGKNGTRGKKQDVPGPWQPNLGLH